MGDDWNPPDTSLPKTSLEGHPLLTHHLPHHTHQNCSEFFLKEVHVRHLKIRLVSRGVLWKYDVCEISLGFSENTLSNKRVVVCFRKIGTPMNLQKIKYVQGQVTVKTVVHTDD